MGVITMNQVLPFLMFLVLFGIMLLNVPVAFATLLTAIIFCVVLWGWGGLGVIFQSLWGAMTNWVLASVPLFVFMSLILEKGGIVAELYESFRKLVGNVRGSLAIISMMLGFVFGMMSGVIAGAVVSMAVLIYPIMLKFGYDKRFSIGALLAAGTLPQIVPPSLNMILYGTVVGVSVASLFAGGFIISIIMTALFLVYVIIWTQLNKDKVPIVREYITLKDRLIAILYLIGPIAIIGSVLGTIFTGMTTPTEAAGFGAFASLVYVLVRRKLSWKILRETLMDTLKITSMAIWMYIGGTTFSAVFAGIGGKRLLYELMVSLPQAKITALILSLLIIFILGMFIETGSIIVLMGPVLGPVMEWLGYDPLWWGLVFCTTLQTAFLTPPVGMALFYFKGVRPEVPFDDMIKSVISYIILQIATVIVIIIFPDVVLIPIKIMRGG
jgi:tripartite ATP-independent transporter DctM subunit